MMLAVDARWMIGRFRGMGRYAHALLAPVRTHVRALLPEGMSSPDFPTTAKGNAFFPYWEQVVLPRLCEELKVQELVCPYNTAPCVLPRDTRLTLVVHDLIYLEPWNRLPPSVSLYQNLGRVYRRLVVPRVARSATRIVVVSEYTRVQLMSRFGISASRIELIPNSLPDSWYVSSPLPQHERLPYVLAVTGEAPSKNVPGLLRGFAQFCRDLPARHVRPELKIVGISATHRPHFERLARRIGVTGRVTFLDFVAESQLQRLYREATLFVMPSLYEGFGIPVLEALASGTAIVSSNSTALPELVGRAGWLIDPRVDSQIGSALLEAWLSPAERNARALLGLEQAQRFRQRVVRDRIAAFWGATSR